MKTRPRTKPIRVIVVHTNEGPESLTGAEDLARYLQHEDAGYHTVHDMNSSVRLTTDNMAVEGAPFVNDDGLHCCGTGYAAQRRTDWLDSFSRGELDQMAMQVAEWCNAHSIPAVKLTSQELHDGKEGIVGHIDVTTAYKEDGRRIGITLDHWDPGPNFPWSIFISLVQQHMGKVQEDDDVPAETAITGACSDGFGGRWKSSYNGGVFTDAGKFYGSYLSPFMKPHRNDPKRRCIGITPRHDKKPGYTQVFNDGAEYTFGVETANLDI